MPCSRPQHVKSPYLSWLLRVDYRWALLLAAGLSVLEGLLVMVAWHTRTTIIIQWPPGSPPIRYNAALMLVLVGLALLAWLGRRRYIALGLSSAVIFISGLTLAQYVFGVDFGIDQLLMHDYITGGLYASGHSPSQGGYQGPVQQFFIQVEHPFLGRPSPNAAAGLLLVGTAALCLTLSGGPGRKTTAPSVWENRLDALTATLSAGVVGMALITLLGYVTRLSTAYTWRYLTGLAVLTSVALLGLGLGLVLAVLNRRQRDRQPRWLLTTVGFGIGTVSLLLWQALISWSYSLQGKLPAGGAVEVSTLMVPVANIVLIACLLLGLALVTAMHFYQSAQAQTSQLQHLTQELTRSRSLLQTTLEATADGILVLDADWRVVYFNQRFTRLWGIPQDLVNAVKQSAGAQNFYPYTLDQVEDREAFNTASQQMMADLGCKNYDLITLKNGRVLERHTRPHWLGDCIVGKVLSYRDVTEHHRAEASLRTSEERYRSVVAALSEGIVLQDAAGDIQTCNAKAEEILGLTLAQMQGRNSIDPLWRAVHEDGSPFPGDQHPAMVTLRTGEPCRNVVMGVHNPAGDLTWLSINAQPIMQPGEGQPHAVVTSFADITQRKQVEEALFYEKELAQVTLHSIGDAVITTDVRGCIRYVNPVAEALTGWRQLEAEGQPLANIFNIVHEDTHEPVSNPVTIALRESRTVALHPDTVLLARDGHEIGIEDSAAPICDRSGNTVGAVMVFHDVTQARHLTRQVTWQAIHDSLTGLVNRHEFEQRLGQALRNAPTCNEVHVLCYLDLDQFKIVNDTCGHSAGDELLRQVTALLQNQVRKTDTLARLGGDEFGVLLHQCNLNQALRVANLLRETIQDFRFVWEGNSFAIGVSVGIVPIDGQSRSLQTLLSAADSACYAAKNNGRNRVHVFQADDQTLVQQQGEMRWAPRLTRALEENRFCLFAQPIVATQPHLSPEKHYEVLLRLWDETGALVPPMAFLPAAERYGLMTKIDRWVVSTLFRHWPQLQPLPGGGGDYQPRIYAINLSGATLNDDGMVDFLQQQFIQYDVPYDQICFEITETVAIANLSKAGQFIQQLRALGCRFALDDFGSGMSSFAYLKHLSVDYLKIDGGFVKDILNDPADDAMVEAINHIGQVMGLKTIAEYVENTAILERITALGVDFAQGYGIAKPALLIPTSCWIKRG